VRGRPDVWVRVMVVVMIGGGGAFGRRGGATRPARFTPLSTVRGRTPNTTDQIGR